MAPRAYVSTFAINLGPIQLLGKLLPLVKSEKARGASKFRQVIPDTEVPTLAKQRYIAEGTEDNESPTIYTQRDLVYALETDDGLSFVDPDEVTEARSSDLPLNVCSVTIHPTVEVQEHLYPASSSYVFEPLMANDHYAALLGAIDNPDFTFLAATNLRNNEGLYRLHVHNSTLVVQKMYWPEDLNEIEVAESESTDELTGAVAGMVEAMVTEFDPETYTSTTREKIAAVEGGETFSPEATVAEAEGSDLLDLLAGYAEEAA